VVARETRCLVGIDGEVVDPGEARVSVFDRGFLYGDGLFETIRVYGGRPFRAREHVERLEWSAERLRLDLGMGLDALEAEVLRFVELGARELGTGELALRLMVTRGQGPSLELPGLLPAPTGAKSQRLLFVSRHKPLPASLYSTGATAITYATHRPSDGVRGAKVTNYVESIQALLAARDRGAHEALIVSADGEVLEGTTSNVFVVRAGRLETPPRTSSLLPGITRAEVIALAGNQLVETRLEPEDLRSAEEVFITSTLREIVPITSVDERPIGDGMPGPVTRALAEALRERIRNAVR
jgi:branched-chain amino acid aminotransferase